LVTTTSGSTPFFLNTHVRDLGNFLVIGPSGYGKTYLLNAIAIAHRQYERAQINFFDRDAGAVVPTLACGGEFFDIDAMHFAPLAHIDEEDERTWALWFCERCAKLRDFAMTPTARADVERALIALSTAPTEHRTLTNLLAQIQTHEHGLKEALSFYTLGSGGAILDGVATPTQEESWRTCDMEKLLARGHEARTSLSQYGPVDGRSPDVGAV
jgi:type IV secretion system protein VirB4